MDMKVILKSFMITCLEATMFVSQKEESKLSLRDQFKLYIHNSICKFCRLFEKQNKFLILQMKHIHTETVLTGPEKEQIQKKIEEYLFSK